MSIQSENVIFPLSILREADGPDQGAVLHRRRICAVIQAAEQRGISMAEECAESHDVAPFPGPAPGLKIKCGGSKAGWPALLNRPCPYNSNRVKTWPAGPTREKNFCPGSSEPGQKIFSVLTRFDLYGSRAKAHLIPPSRRSDTP